MTLKHVTISGIRLHLNTQENSLLINGYYQVQLNNTAKMEIEFFIDSCNEEPYDNIIPATLDKIQRWYRKLSREQADRDVKKLIEVINYFGKGQVPSHLVGLEKFSDRKVPMRMDLALTYRCDNKCPHCYLWKNESTKELTSQDWKRVIDNLWKIGIPQVAFTGGECTLRSDLAELVKYSEQMITGVITNGTLLTEDLAHELKKANLDWIQITLESSKKETHDEMQGVPGAFGKTVQGIRNAVAAGLSVSVDATLTRKNCNDLPDLIRFAKSLGATFVGANALINSGRGTMIVPEDGIPESELTEILTKARETAAIEDIEFNWFLPTCYNQFDPVKNGFGQRCCSACSINMLIEPDGTVIPCQSWTTIKLGNIITTPWNKIWDSEISKKIRNHQFAPDECKKCDKLEICGGACPLSHLNNNGGGNKV
jgi:radical SAM protein with 4Fe4S-binding SPASM domain